MPRATEQPLAFLYLSQIPYTGLTLGPWGTALYWTALVFWSLALAYLLLFRAVPFMTGRAQGFVGAVQGILKGQQEHIDARYEDAAPTLAVAAAAPQYAPEAARGFSSFEGFKSFGKEEGPLSIEDIVKGLSRQAVVGAPMTAAPQAPQPEPARPYTEPIMPAELDAAPVASIETPMNANSFAAALVAGDRAGVFSALRALLKEGHAPESLITRVVSLLDDAYRARIDNTPADPDILRVVARLDTGTLERLIMALTTATDASYSSGVTGAKLALTRALGVIGA